MNFRIVLDGFKTNKKTKGYGVTIHDTNSVHLKQKTTKSKSALNAALHLIVTVRSLMWIYHVRKSA